MSYKELTTHNRSFIKRFTHSKRFKLVKSFANCTEHDTVLDYGTGNGELFLTLKSVQLKQKYAYEPIPHMYDELINHLAEHKISNVKCVLNLEEADGLFTKIFCLEVLEHFNAEQQKGHLTKMLNLLEANGELIISVPIEVGFAAFVKNSLRILIGQRPENLNFKTLLKVLFGMPIERKQGDYIFSHIGFNHKRLEEVFKHLDLKITKKRHAPIPLLAGILNSQVLYKLKKS
ncbi:MAG: class I SAM-dependent methyltransferase [bacterium]